MKHIIGLILIVLISFTTGKTQQKISHSTKKLVYKISAVNKYESQFVGFAGTPSQQYLNFQHLRQSATQEELQELLRHKNAVVRIYSFKALYEKNRKAAEQHSRELLKDTARFMTLQGCIAGSDRVKNTVRRILRRAD